MSDKVKTHPSLFQKYESQLLYYLQVLISYKELSKFKTLTKISVLDEKNEKKFPGIIVYFLNDLKAKRKKLQNSRENKSLN